MESVSVIAFANVIVQAQINSFGKLAMAAYGTHSKVEGFAFLPITSFNMAITTFISQNLGAGKKDRAKKGAFFGIGLGMLMAEVVGVIVYAGAKFALQFFVDTPEAVRRVGDQMPGAEYTLVEQLYKVLRSGLQMAYRFGQQLSHDELPPHAGVPAPAAAV